MKKIDKLLVTSFFGPFGVSFGIALFVLIMQFLWLYIDEIAGKGVSIFVMLELLGYLSISVFPMALAIAVLISSVMVLGNFSERYELSSMKSAGISLLRVMRPLVLLTVGIAMFSWFCSNKLIPIANLQFKTRLYDIRKQKPALTLEAGVFNEDFRNFSIRIGQKSRDGETIGNVMIDDASQVGRNEFSQILADSGRMFTSPDKRFFVMDLHRGTQYQQPSQSSGGRRKYPFIRTSFQTYRKVWDMAEFDMNSTDPNAFKDNRTMLSMRQLSERADSLYGQAEAGRAEIFNDIMKGLVVPKAVKTEPGKRDSVQKQQKIVREEGVSIEKPTQKTEKTEAQKRIAQPQSAPQNPNSPPPGVGSLTSGGGYFAQKRKQLDSLKLQQKQATQEKLFPKNQVKIEPPKTIPQPPTALPKLEEKQKLIPIQRLTKPLSSYTNWIETLDSSDQKRIMQTASTVVRGQQTTLLSRRKTMERYQLEAVKTAYELYLKYGFAAVCIVFLFIGAPLGAIIRKGGFGYPVIVSITFFMIFIVLSITCRKLAEGFILSPFWAAMVPCFALLPVGIWLTVKAMNDSQIFNLDRYERLARQFGAWFQRVVMREKQLAQN